MSNDKIAPGPEDVPMFGYVKSFKMKVSILKGKDIVREQIINYGDIEHRKWLGKVTYYACSNGMKVQTEAAI